MSFSLLATRASESGKGCKLPLGGVSVKFAKLQLEAKRHSRMSIARFVCTIPPQISSLRSTKLSRGAVHMYSQTVQM